MPAQRKKVLTKRHSLLTRERRDSIKKAQTFAWGWFSKYIRNYRWHINKQRTCICCGTPIDSFTTSKKGGKLITKPIQIHASHLYPKLWYGELFFKEDIVYLGCSTCNKIKQGNPGQYIVNLSKIIGIEKILQLAKEVDRIMKLGMKWKPEQYRAKGEEYKLKYQKLKKHLESQGIELRFK